MRFDSFEAYAFISFLFDLMRCEPFVINRELKNYNGTTEVVRDVSPCIVDWAIVIALRKDILSFQLSNNIPKSFATMHRLL